ncbi:MAG: alpha/beta fold hydrolase [Flavobacteriales bacterium]
MKRTTERSTISRLDSLGISYSIHTTSILKHQLHYAMAGDSTKPMLAIVHGSPGSWVDYERYMSDSALRSHFQMVCIDRPGFGGSNKGEALHLHQQVEIVATVFKNAFPNKKAIWMGHSLGGPFVSMMAMKHNDLVSGLVLLSASVSPQQEAPERWRKIF